MGLFDQALKDVLEKTKESLKEADSALNQLKEAAEKVSKEDVKNAFSFLGNLANNAGEVIKEEAEASFHNEAPVTYDNVSYGEFMPDEENQYNYPGNYVEYFEDVLKKEFPQYQLDIEPLRNNTATAFYLNKDGKKEMVIEVMSENSAAKKFRKECLEQGLRYLRFYYNHPGWWNTRAYVVERINKALNQ